MQIQVAPEGMSLQRVEHDMVLLLIDPQTRKPVIDWLNHIIGPDFRIVDDKKGPSANDGKITLTAECQRIQTDSPDGGRIQQPKVKLVLDLVQMRIEAITCEKYCGKQECHLDRNVACKDVDDGDIPIKKPSEV